jgi:formate dehydrogenase subunit delta
MMSSADRLVTMANQIASFFAAYPHEEAVEGTLEHIRLFWDPRMKAQIAGLEQREGAIVLSPIAREAVDRLKQSVKPA